MHLRNHENFEKMKHKNFTLGGFCPGRFVGGGIVRGVFVLEPYGSIRSGTLAS